MAQRRKDPWPFQRLPCLEWQGLKDEDGYGRVKWEGLDSRVHRTFYQLWYGKTLETGDVLLHSCDNPACFNPHHLTVGTQLDNVKDMDSKGRRVSASSFVSHCPRGHAYSVENTIVYKDGKRRCKTCITNRRKNK